MRPVSISFCMATVLILIAGCSSQDVRTAPGQAGRTISEDLYCSGEITGADYTNHVLVVERKGEFEPTELKLGGQPPGAKMASTFKAQFQKILEAQRRYRQKKEQQGRNLHAKRVLIFINGGLNSRKTSLRRAAEQSNCIEAAGYFPIFLIWRSSGPESYWEQISQVRDGYLRSRPSLTTPLYLFGDLGQGVARAPATWSSQFGRWREGVLEALGEPREFKAADGINVQYDGPEQPRADFHKDALTAMLSTPLKMITTPFVDGVGRTAWENMLRRTRMTLRRAAEFEPNHADDVEEFGREMMRYPRGTGAFGKFFSELEACVLADADRPTYPRQARICIEQHIGQSLQDTQITLIGHSMGAIVINEIVRRYYDLPYRNLVFMGAATSIRDTLDSMVPFLARDVARETEARNAGRSYRPARFYSLSLHPVAEKHENTIYELPPDGSLLTWIDDMFESAPSVTDRTFGRWRNIELTSHVIPSGVRNRMYFRIFGFRKPDPARRDPGDPIVHGAFSDTEMHYWLSDFWWSKALQ